MKRAVCGISFCLLGLGMAVPGLAQEGHPLKGSWIGKWNSNEIHGESVLLVLDWNGDEITGVINPGTDNIEISNAELQPEDWTVMLEARGEVEGEPVNYTIEGRIENLESPSRMIVGNWRNQENSGEFEISRQ